MCAPRMRSIEYASCAGARADAAVVHVICSPCAGLDHSIADLSSNMIPRPLRPLSRDAITASLLCPHDLCQVARAVPWQGLVTPQQDFTLKRQLI
jgi:hypothetical protein